jgi:hypothetical protein
MLFVPISHVPCPGDLEVRPARIGRPERSGSPCPLTCHIKWHEPPTHQMCCNHLFWHICARTRSCQTTDLGAFHQRQSHQHKLGTAGHSGSSDPDPYLLGVRALAKAESTNLLWSPAGKSGLQRRVGETSVAHFRRPAPSTVHTSATRLSEANRDFVTHLPARGKNPLSITKARKALEPWRLRLQLGFLIMGSHGVPHVVTGLPTTP